MSASREKKSRADSTYVQRRNHHETDKNRRKHILYGVAGGVVAVLAIALLVWDSGLFQKRATAVTIDGESYGPAVVQYYYQSALNTARYGSMMGSSDYASFDYSTDPADQVYDAESGQAWKDHLLDQAIEDLTQVTALVHAAEEEGYSLTQKDQAYLDSELSSLDQAWRSSGTYASLDSYLKVNFGNYMDEDTFRSLYTDQVLADSYRNAYQNSLTYTDEEVEAYYAEHTNDLDTFTYSVLTVRASVEEQTDEDGNTVEMTEEETQAAFDTAKSEAQTLAQEIQARLAAGDDVQALVDEYGDRLYNSSVHAQSLGSASAISSAQYADWLYDTARQSGEVTIVENDGSANNTYTYYVVQFENRERNEDPTADVRHILIGAAASGSTPTEEEFAAAEEEAQALLDQWKAEDGTEDGFAALAVQNTDDSGSLADGGLYTGISSLDSWDQNFEDWCLDPARQPGDTGLVKNESSQTQGWHIMYFVGWDDPQWKYTVKSSFKSDDVSTWLDGLTENVETTRGSGMDYVG